MRAAWRGCRSRAAAAWSALPAWRGWPDQAGRQRRPQAASQRWPPALARPLLLGQLRQLRIRSNRNQLVRVETRDPLPQGILRQRLSEPELGIHGLHLLDPERQALALIGP